MRLHTAWPKGPYLMSVTVPFTVIPVVTRWRAQSLGIPVALLRCLPSTSAGLAL